MCMTTSEAKLSGTQIYVGEAIKDDKLVHVLAYQNIAESKSSEPNAMILPFPTSKLMNEANILDTRKYSDFLKSISESSKMLTLNRGLDEDSLVGCAGAAHVFDSGSYTVILVKNLAQVPEALKRVPESKRPKISTHFLIRYGQMYPGQPVAICCWEGYIEAEPLLWWYEPKDDRNLFVPTMDAHDGNPPDLTSEVWTDHIISVGTNVNAPRNGHKVVYKSEIDSSAKQLLPKKVFGCKIHGLMKNGDMFIDVSELREASSNLRVTPMIKRGSSITDIFSGIQMNGWT